MSDCDTCVHKKDSGTEYCGCCDNLTNNYEEAGWHIKQRLQERIDELERQLKND